MSDIGHILPNEDGSCLYLLRENGKIVLKRDGDIRIEMSPKQAENISKIILRDIWDKEFRWDI